jgi:hypothetical protein
MKIPSRGEIQRMPIEADGPFSMHPKIHVPALKIGERFCVLKVQPLR